MKQVIVMRTDLNMRKGKMIAQGAHASMKAIIDDGFIHNDALENKNYLMIPITNILDAWLINGSFKKICVQVNSEEELLKLKQQAEDADIVCALITDSGLTEFNGVPTITCIAIGPAPSEKIDLITGNLKLL